jgi:antitoxin component of RelBE/YafQ-DinJ toxin-antitoxin module
MKAKETRISVRIDPELKERLERAIDQTGVDESSVVRQCLEAFCELVEQNGRVSFPIKLDAAHDSSVGPAERKELKAPTEGPKLKSGHRRQST